MPPIFPSVNQGEFKKETAYTFFSLLTSFSLTGENEPQRKDSGCPGVKSDGSILELDNILFMGTNVISGSGLAVVLRTGDGKFYPPLPKNLRYH